MAVVAVLAEDVDSHSLLLEQDESPPDDYFHTKTSFRPDLEVAQ